MDPLAGLDLAVVGAHLEGMPSHPELAACGARLLERTATAPSYRLYRLRGGPARPGLVRVASGGRTIEVETYRLPLAEVGGFLSTVSAPLAIGTVLLASGAVVHGFVCEPIGLEDAVDITAFGGWRTYVGAAPPASMPEGSHAASTAPHEPSDLLM